MTRNHLLFAVNGRPYRIGGSRAFQTLSDFLRCDWGLVGTKIVCKEGDCGACTVLLGRPEAGGFRYGPVDSCILPLALLDGRHVVTVEGVGRSGALSEVQEALIACHGSQCGFCTPGFVMALTGLFERRETATDLEVRNALSGNLCRCTGYTSILEAARTLNDLPLRRLDTLYPPEQLLAEFAAHRDETVEIDEEMGEERRSLAVPATLAEALHYRSEHPDAVVIAGGTDLGVQINQGRISPRRLLCLARLEELRGVEISDGLLIAGAGATWTAMEEAIRDVLPEFHILLNRFGSPQIRNLGTLGGNLANASPIADSLPLLYALEAHIELESVQGRRVVAVQEFYRGYKSLDLQPEELIVRVHIPLPAPDEKLKLYRVSRRTGMDIATFGAAIRMILKEGTIHKAILAYGGVGPTVVRLPAAEAYLTGKPFTPETLQAAGALARREIAPISDVRAARDYRRRLAENVLMKFYHEVIRDL